MNDKENDSEKPNSSEDVVTRKNDIGSLVCNETISDEADLERSKADEDWILKMSSLHERFSRSSWINKFLFLETLCKMASKCFVLETVLKSIRTILSKDAVEWLYNIDTIDKMPKTDSRNIIELTENDFYWFSNLNPSRQILTLLQLLKISDDCIVFNIYKTAEKMFKRKESLTTLSNLPQRMSLRKESKTPTIRLSINTLESGVSQAGEFTGKKLQMLIRRKEELLKFKKANGILGEEKVLKIAESKEAVDWIQLLPIWVNRKIMSYIDDKSLAGLKKVGKYWAKMIDESITEKTGRTAINAKINKIEGVRPGKMKKAEEEKNEVEDFEFIMELGSNELLAKIGLEKAMMSSSEKYKRIFSKQYTVTDMTSSFFAERCGTFNSAIETLACSTLNNMVHFYSTKTGARLNDSIFNISSPITCLALHEDKLHVFLGCKDGSLLSKNIKTNEELGSFKSHTKPVIAMCSTTSQLLTASEDNTIKYFQLWSGLYLMCFDLSPFFNISCFLLRDDGPLWSALGTVEGVLVLLDIKTSTCIQRVQLHNTKIVKVATDGDLLVTACKRGKIRVWDMNHLENNFNVLKPYYNIILDSPVSSLIVHNHQIFSGCENGTFKIISLATGKVFKTMKISSQTTILGLAMDEDKVSTKLIIWYEGGIEMRTFSLLESSRNKKSMEKDNRKSKQKAPIDKTTPK